MIGSYVGPTYSSVVDNALPAGSYDTSMRITATIVLDQPLPPNLQGNSSDPPWSVLSFAVSDGRATITDADVRTWTLLSFRTNASGEVFDFIIDVSTARHWIYAEPYPPSFALFSACDRPCDSSLQDVANSGALASGWTFTPIPEPSTGALMALGMVALAARGRAILAPPLR